MSRYATSFSEDDLADVLDALDGVRRRAGGWPNPNIEALYARMQSLEPVEEGKVHEFAKGEKVGGLGVGYGTDDGFDGRVKAQLVCLTLGGGKTVVIEPDGFGMTISGGQEL